MNSESKEEQELDNQVSLSIPLRYDAEIHFTRYAINNVNSHCHFAKAFHFNTVTVSKGH